MSNAINEMLLQPSPLGEVFVSARDVAGPTSYTTGGVTVSANGWAMLTLKTLISDHLSQDGLYYAKFIMPRGAGYPTAKMLWYPATPTVPGVALGLGALSAAATTSVFTSSGVGTIVVANSLQVGQFVLLSGGATAKSIFLNGVIVQVTAASATQFSFNYGAAKALHYASAADTALKFQVVQVNSNNQLQAIAATGPVTSVAVASGVLTVVQANTFSVGNFVILQGLAAGEVPQGVIVQIASASTTGWTANIQAVNLSATSGETGTASLLVTNGGAPVTTSGALPITNSVAVASAAAATGLLTLTAANALAAGNIVVVQGVSVNSVLDGTIASVISTSLTNASFEAQGWSVVASTSAETTGVASLLVTGSAPSADSDGEVASGTNLSTSYIRTIALGN